jgi:cyclase
MASRRLGDEHRSEESARSVGTAVRISGASARFWETMMIDRCSSFNEVRKYLAVFGVVVLGGLLGSGAANAQEPARRPSQAQAPIRSVPVSDGFFILTGRGTNMGVSVGEDGLVLVNAGFAAGQPQTMEALAKLSDKPIKFIIDTDWHDPNVSGNTLMAKTGAILVANENVRKRLSMERVDPGNATLKIPAYPKEGLPTVTYSDEMALHVNGEDIYIFHPANAHSDSDSMVYFPKANVLTTGDIYYSNNWPLIDLPSKGTVNGVIAAADRALKIINANTKVVPGRGPVATAKDFTEYRAMLATIRDRVAAGIREGKTLEQVLATKPTAEYEAAKKGTGELVVNRTGADLVKWVYQDLSSASR